MSTTDAIVDQTSELAALKAIVDATLNELDYRGRTPPAFDFRPERWSARAAYALGRTQLVLEHLLGPTEKPPAA